MSAVLESARGASAFTHADRSLLHAAGEPPFLFAETSDSPAHAWGSLIDELFRLRKLEDDWDGQGSPAPHPALVDWAVTLAHSLEAGGYPPADRVLASVNGTVYFEWHGPLGYEEIEVMAPNDAEYRRVPKGSDVATIAHLTGHP